MRTAIAFVAALAAAALSGCADFSRTPAGSALALLRGPEAAPEGSAEVARAELEASPYAYIAVSRSEDGPRAYLAAAAASDGYVTYVTRDRRSVTLQGAAVVGTHGLGVGLIGRRAKAGEDPLVAPRAVAEWPREIVRAYRFRDPARPMGRVAAVRCRMEPAGEERIEILGRAHATVRVEERCWRPGGAFANTYWADPRSGFVWKSLQTTPSGGPPLYIEVVRPFRS